jgi:hypothetical protein
MLAAVEKEIEESPQRHEGHKVRKIGNADERRSEVMNADKV